MYDASQKTEVRDKLFDLLFLRTPISILGTKKIEGIELAVNHLEGKNLLCNFINIITLIIFDKQQYLQEKKLWLQMKSIH